jgi:hypothetical protein
MKNAVAKYFIISIFVSCNSLSFCQTSDPYKLLYSSQNLNDFVVVDECNPGGGTDCPCSITDVGINYKPDYIEVISNKDTTHTWVNAIAYKKYVNSLPEKPIRLTTVKYRYKTKLPIMPFPDTSQHQNPGSVHIMMQMYNGDGS